MSDSNDQAEGLVEAALDFPPEQRKAYLDNACGEDAQLRQLAEALLRAHEQSFAMPQTAAQTVPLHRPVAPAADGERPRASALLVE